MNFEELVEYLGLDEPEIIDYNSGAEFGGLTEEQQKYILSEFINGRPVYLMETVTPYGQSTTDAVFTDTTLMISQDMFGLTSIISSEMGSQIIIAFNNLPK